MSWEEYYEQHPASKRVCEVTRLPFKSKQEQYLHIISCNPDAPPLAIAHALLELNDFLIAKNESLATALIQMDQQIDKLDRHLKELLKPYGITESELEEIIEPSELSEEITLPEIDPEEVEKMHTVLVQKSMVRIESMPLITTLTENINLINEVKAEFHRRTK